jgi:hypothetical protein
VRPKAQLTISPTLHHPYRSPHLDSAVAVAGVTLLTGNAIDLTGTASTTRAVAGAVVLTQVVKRNARVNGDRAGLLGRGRTGRGRRRGEARRSGNGRRIHFGGCLMFLLCCKCVYVL